MSGKTPQQALDQVIKVRYVAWPNVRILRLASDILGQDIATSIAEWKKRVIEGADNGDLFLPPEYNK